MRCAVLLCALALGASIVPTPASAQGHHAGVMKRGAEVMGFDQQATTHHFRLLPTGGAIEVTANDQADAAGIAQIRAHLQHIATTFRDGNFSAPMLIHAQEPPGVAAMKRAGTGISYRYESIDRGGRVDLVTTDHVEAVHEFLRFQITDHRTGDPLTVSPPPQ